MTPAQFVAQNAGDALVGGAVRRAARYWDQRIEFDGDGFSAEDDAPRCECCRGKFDAECSDPLDDGPRWSRRVAHLVTIETRDFETASSIWCCDECTDAWERDLGLLEGLRAAEEARAALRRCPLEQETHLARVSAASALDVMESRYRCALAAAGHKRALGRVA